MRKLFLFFLFSVFLKWHFLDNKKMLFSPLFYYLQKKKTIREQLFSVFFFFPFLSFVIRMRFEFFLSCVISFFIFPVYIFPFGCWEKWGTRKKTKTKKIPDFSHFLVLIFLELFCSRKTKNLLKDMEDKENRIAYWESFASDFCLSFEEDERWQKVTIVICK